MEHVVHGGAILGVVLVLAAAVGLPTRGRSAPSLHADVFSLTGGDLSERGLKRLAGALPAGAALIAARLAPAPRTAFSWRAPGDAPAGPQDDDDPGTPPVLALPSLTPEAARALNASIPLSTLPNPPARPFRLQGGELLDEARAIDCLTAAVYYEAGFEPLAGQQAVAQVVLNRLRHPAFPKTVCGVVFQGANRKTGCQFTFTCDGALARRPDEAAWRRSREVAAAALTGFVMTSVGEATHYHAVYVAPYWNTSLLKVANIGAHVFYRWTGGWGQAPSFNGLWAGAEPQVMPASLTSPPPPSLGPLVDQTLVLPAAPSMPETFKLKPQELTQADTESRAPPAAQATAAAVSSTPDKPAIAKPASARPETQRKRPDQGWSRLPVPSTW